MNLSTKRFAEIVQRLEGDVGDQLFPGHDKRRSTRVGVRSRASIVPYTNGVAREGVGVELRDFSHRGIRFLHSARLARGDQFVLELPQREGKPVHILCTVMHCRTTPEGFSTGAEFTCVLRPQQPSPQGRPGRSEAGAADAARRRERDRIRQSILG
jgi:hypothetical protein